MQNREMQKMQEEALFENRLAQELLRKGKTQKLASVLEMNEMKLHSGMTAEEIDAVKKRAENAFKSIDVD
ncbi:MAG: hypothetical protein FWC70_06245 [Defluviitaleaceae bacterium]|nr:hypothetical protein [Defluviitaleaceae bacterium]